MQIAALAHASVEKDHRLIMDAVRRLDEGTWHLCDEDSDWTNHLFPSVNEALLDHCNVTCIDNKIIKRAQRSSLEYK